MGDILRAALGEGRAFRKLPPLDEMLNNMTKQPTPRLKIESAQEQAAYDFLIHYLTASRGRVKEPIPGGPRDLCFAKLAVVRLERAFTSKEANKITPQTKAALIAVSRYLRIPESGRGGWRDIKERCVRPNRRPREQDAVIWRLARYRITEREEQLTKMLRDAAT